jgi:hypothetical protein
MTTTLKRLQNAQYGSCSCLTKTPELKYHDESCKFRLCAEAEAEIHHLQKFKDRYNWLRYQYSAGIISFSGVAEENEDLTETNFDKEVANGMTIRPIPKGNHDPL